jgi:hypothetical protein
VNQNAKEIKEIEKKMFDDGWIVMRETEANMRNTGEGK